MTDRSYDKKAYHSKFQDQLKLYAQMERDQQEKAAEEKRQRVEKQKHYQHVLKEKHQPTVDPNKVLEMKAVLDRLQNKRKYIRRLRNLNLELNDNSDGPKILSHLNVDSQLTDIHVPSYEEARNMGNKYLQQSKTVTKKDRDKSETQIPSQSDMSSPQTKGYYSLHYKNYLNDLKKQNKNWGKRNQSVDLINWEKELNSSELQLNDKLDKIMNKINKIDQAAQNKERQMLYQNNSFQLQQQEQTQLEDYYVQSIRAKIAILKQFTPDSCK